ncbi:MAG: hypothetical protein ACOY0T_05750 [Myxococcota bacterium]
MAKLADPSAFNIHALTVKTWDAKLRRDLRLLVPIHVDALVVRSDGGAVADCTMRTPSGTPGERSIDLLPAPFVDRDAPRPRGVHLHWAMPDGLSTLRAENSGPSSAALPDRWLIARIAPGKTGRRSVTAWILDSRNATSTPLEGWTAAPPTGKPVTVLGIGDAGWAAYYDNVVNRFAFHDPLEQVPNGKIAYLVCGWYADAALDPLATNTATLHAFEARMLELGWDAPIRDLKKAKQSSQSHVSRIALSGLETPHAARDEVGNVVYAKNAKVASVKGLPIAGEFQLADVYWPQDTLFHGAVVDLSWPTVASNSPEVGGPPNPATVDVALGVTPADALAAIIARTSGSEQEADFLTAFTLGALEDLQQPDGDAKLADRLHDAAFASLSDGTERVPRAASVMPDKPPPKQPPTKRPPKRWLTKQGDFQGVHRTKPEPLKPPEPTEVELPRPRLFFPPDPAIAIHGAFRSPKHGGDGRFSDDGRLMCRVSSTPINCLTLRASPTGARVAIRASDVLERPLLHGGVPPECQQLLEELGLLDPGTSAVIAEAITKQGRIPEALPKDTLTRIAATEQTAWWATRRATTDARAIAVHSGLEGTLPSPVAVRPPAKPWVPLHLDWEVEYLPAPARNFSLGEIDFAPPSVPEGTGELFRGRSLLSGGIATALADSVQKYLDDERAAGRNALADADHTSEAQDIVNRLRALDTLQGPLEGLHRLLRKDLGFDSSAQVPAPAGFVAVRSGFLRLKRLRLVDAFGQILNLAGSSATEDANPERVAVGDGAEVPGKPGVAVLPPRFTAPAKLSFRFRDASTPNQDANEARSPVCGFLLPDHIDEALEFFDANGEAIGQIRIDTDVGPLWELAPGLPTAVGASPKAAISHPELGAFAQYLLEQSVRDQAASKPLALVELLRVIDSTRWTVDPFAHVGEEHLSLLIGHPVAVIAASLELEVREPVSGTDVPITRVPVRLGALTHWQDGLFGYFVNGQFDTFHCARAAAAFARPLPSAGFLGPVESVPGYAATFASDVQGDAGATPASHPYLDSSGILWIVPGIRYELLLLVEPHCAVHATTGLLPRKQIAPQRAWLHEALAHIAPTFRFGPVLIDPKQIRMPIPSDIEGAWTWTHRADVDRWAEYEVVHAGQEALLSPDPYEASEGWLRLRPATKPEGGG